MANLRLTQHRIFRDNHHIAAHHELEPARECIAVHGRDDGDRRVMNELQAAHVLADVAAPAVGIHFEVLATKIEARRERTAGPGQHHCPDVGILDRTSDRILKRISKRLIHGVHLVRAIHDQRDECVLRILVPDNEIF